jgi:hypothetical protein
MKEVPPIRHERQSRDERQSTQDGVLVSKAPEAEPDCHHNRQADEHNVKPFEGHA